MRGEPAGACARRLSSCSQQARRRDRARRCRRSRCASIAARRSLKTSRRRPTAGARRPRGARAPLARFTALSTSRASRCVGVLPRSPELFDQRIVGPRVEAVGGENGRLAAGRRRSRSSATRSPRAPRRVGQHVDRLLQRNGANLLQPPPGAGRADSRAATAADGRTAASGERLRRSSRPPCDRPGRGRP